MPSTALFTQWKNASNKNEHYCLGKTMNKIHRLYVDGEKLNIIVYLLYASFINSRKGKTNPWRWQLEQWFGS